MASSSWPLNLGKRILAAACLPAPSLKGHVTFPILVESALFSAPSCPPHVTGFCGERVLFPPSPLDVV